MAHSSALSLVALAVTASLSPLALAVDAKEGEVVVVSGSRMAQKLEDVSGPITVITDKQIEEQGVSNATELFRYEPGVKVLSGSNNGMEGQTFSIRGMGGNRVKVVSDGVRKNDAYSEGGVGQNYFDTDMIKQVEVVKGPASAAYGSDAMGGVIAITTKDAADFLRGKETYLDVTGGYGSANEQAMGGFTGAVRSGDTEHLIRYSQRRGGVTQNYASSQYDFDIVTNSLLLKSNWNITPNQKLKLAIDYFNEARDADEFYNSAQLRTRDEDSQSLGIALDYHLFMDSLLADNLSAKVYTNRFDQESNKELGNREKGNTGFNTFDQNTVGAQLQFDKQAGVHNLVWGAEYEKTATDRLKTQTTYPSATTTDRTPFPKSDTVRSALWMFDNIYLGEQWVITPGLRYDHYQLDAKGQAAASASLDEGELSPKLGLVYKAHELANLFAQYSHGFRAPNYSEALSSFSYSVPGYTHFFIPNADLKPETSDSIDLGVRGSNDSFDHEISAFRTKYKDFIDADNTPSYGRTGMTMVTQYVNRESVTTKGAEMKLGYWFNSDWYGWGQVAYITGKDQQGHYVNSISPLNGNVGVRYEQPTWNINTAVRFADQMDKVGQDSNGNSTRTAAGWGVVDLYAQFTPLENMQVNVGVFNLLDKEYLTYERVAGKDTTTDVSAFTEPGRNLSARIKYQF